MTGYFGRVLSMANPAPAAPLPADVAPQGIVEQEVLVKASPAPPDGPAPAAPAAPPPGRSGQKPEMRPPEVPEHKAASRSLKPAPKAPPPPVMVSTPPRATERSAAPRAIERPPTRAEADAPIETEVFVEAAPTPRPRPDDLLCEVRRWIATPPPERPPARSSAPALVEVEEEVPPAAMAVRSSCGAKPAAARVETTDVHIGSIHVTVEEAAPAASRAKTKTAQPQRPQATFDRGWMQRHLVRT
jgi:hypothetical protein